MVLVDDLLFAVVSDTFELTAGERLHIVLESGRMAQVSQRWLASLFQACGCREEARKIYTMLGHWRLLGDLALAAGDLESALEYFSKPPTGSREKVPRHGPDHDRIRAV